MNSRTSAVLFILRPFAGQSARGGDLEVVASPNAGRQANSLSSIAAVTDNDVWAVGWAFNVQFNTYRTVTEHWNGTHWSLVRSPNATNGYNFLNGVGVVAANDVWSVGQAANGSTYSTLVEHWNGMAWSIVPSPNVAGNSNVLEAISVVSANDIWAVGYSTDSNFNNHSLTIHWNGTSWSVFPTPDFDPNATNQGLVGVVALSSEDIWTAGQYIVPLQGSAQFTLTENWDGSNWNFVPSPNAQNSNNRLHGITATPDGTLWAVGTTGVFTRPERTLILRKNP